MPPPGAGPGPFGPLMTQTGELLVPYQCPPGSLCWFPSHFPVVTSPFYRLHLSRRGRSRAPAVDPEAPTNTTPAAESPGGAPLPANSQALEEANQVVEALGRVLGVWGGDRILQLLAWQISEDLIRHEGGGVDSVDDPNQDRAEGSDGHTSAPNRGLVPASADALPVEGGRGVTAEAPVRQSRPQKRKGAPASLVISQNPGQPVVCYPGPMDPAPCKSPRVQPAHGFIEVSPAPPPPSQAGPSQARSNRPHSRKPSQKRVSFIESAEAPAPVSPASQPQSATPSDRPKDGDRVKEKTRAILAETKFSPGVSVCVAAAADDDDIVEVGRVESSPAGDSLPPEAPAGPGAGSVEEVPAGPGAGDVEEEPAPAAANPMQVPGTVTIPQAEFLRLTTIAKHLEAGNAKKGSQRGIRKE